MSVTVTVVEGFDIADPDAVVSVAQAGNYGVMLLIAVILVVIYFGGAALFYYDVEDWSVLEGIYFTVCTFTTVG